jgi:GTPase SAR1 family protein
LSEILWKRIFEKRHGHTSVQIQNYHYACFELQRYAAQEYKKDTTKHGKAYNIVFVGNGDVGKIALQGRMCGNYFLDEYEP